MAKFLIIAGILLLIVGILLHFKISIPFIGRMPGDIFIKGENYTVYFPLMTSIVVSIILSILLSIFLRR